ncbi:MAG: VOC family protein [Thermoleophilia bacterium]
MMRISTVQVWVNNQDDALKFFTEKVGMELRADVTLPELGGFRWLTVGPAGQPDVSIALMEVPEPPMFEAETAKLIKELMGRGATGSVFLTTDDCEAAYNELQGRGVEFVEPPTQRPYGVDCGFRDPFGNHYRLTQVDPAMMG